MQKTRNLLIIAFIILGFVASETYACGNKMQFMNKEDWVQMQSQLSAYYKSDILPYMLKWKSQIDGEMTSQDLGKLNELRKNAKELKEKAKSDFMERKRRMKGDNSDLSDPIVKNKIAKNSEEFRNLISQVQPFVEKYSYVLESLGEEANRMTDIWRENYRTIWEECMQKCKTENEETKDCSRYGKGRKHFGVYSGLNIASKHKALLFLLWDGSDSTPDFVGDPSQGQFIAGAEDNIIDEQGVNNFPNPFKDRATITFNLNNDENVKLTIVDNQGNIVSKLHEGTLPAGEHSFTFDALSGTNAKLPSGTYFYNIEAQSFTRNGKMLLQR